MKLLVEGHWIGNEHEPFEGAGVFIEDKGKLLEVGNVVYVSLGGNVDVKLQGNLPPEDYQHFHASDNGDNSDIYGYLSYEEYSIIRR